MARRLPVARHPRRLSITEEYKRNSPVGIWRFDELAGAVLVDHSGNGRHGTYLNTPGLGQGGTPFRSRAAAFASGTTDAATINLDLSAHEAITVCFWLYKAAFANDNQLAMEFAATSLGGERGWHFNPNDSTPSFYMNLTGSSGFGGPYHGEGYTRPAVGWHFYTGIFDYGAASVDEQIRLFIDAVEQSPFTSGGGADLTGTHANTTLNIARRGNGTLQSEQQIAWLAIFGGRLGADRIRRFYDAGRFAERLTA